MDEIIMLTDNKKYNILILLEIDDMNEIKTFRNLI